MRRLELWEKPDRKIQEIYKNGQKDYPDYPLYGLKNKNDIHGLENSLQDPDLWDTMSY